MSGRLAMLTLLAALAACDAQPPAAPAVVAAPRVPAATVAPSNAQAKERSEACGRLSRETFQREWKTVALHPGQSPAMVNFTNHYNAKLDTCFYLMTVGGPDDGIRKLLFDVNEREPYGEFASARPGSAMVCRVEHLYCGSSGEWDVLVAPYMED